MTLLPPRRALVAILLAVPLITTGGTAQAAACADSSGVTVIVQFPDHTETGCATGDPTSGVQALESAGFSVTPVTGQPFVCRIDELPKTGCGRVPPSSAYWAYFHASRGGSWAYASQGAWSTDPAPGSIEGWRFGGGTRPDKTPPAGASAATTRQPAAAPLDHDVPGLDQDGGNVPWLWGLVGLVAIGGAAGAVTFARRH